MRKKTWFSAKCVFVHRDRGKGPRQLYEERIILVRARRRHKAKKIALREAKSYSRMQADCSYAGYLDLFKLYDKPKANAEVYSVMNQSDLPHDAYIDRYYPSRPPDCEKEGHLHRFYNKGHGYSACYHCDVVKKDDLWK